jgi:transposase
MRTAQEVAAMFQLRTLGWSVRRIAREVGCSQMTVRRYLAAGGWLRYRRSNRGKRLDGLADWLEERTRHHAGNAVAVRRELLGECGITVSLRTVERAVRPFRGWLWDEAHARALPPVGDSDASACANAASGM